MTKRVHEVYSKSISVCKFDLKINIFRGWKFRSMIHENKRATVR